MPAQRQPRRPLQRRDRALPRDQAQRPSAGPDAQPLLPGLWRRGARRRRAAGAGARHRGDRLSSRLRRAAAAHSSTGSALCYLCSPSNPQGAVADTGYWRRLIALAERHDFRILADECYSEIYRDTAPPGALEVAAAAGADPERVVIFQSLSKRSNAPGLRSGFAAGGPRAIAALKELRAYGGAPLPLPLQHAATALWNDEAHVEASRALYHEKFALADRMLGNMPGYTAPEAGFFLWLRVGDGEAAALRLWRETGVRVLPGGYLGRASATAANPGQDYIRVALVADAARVERGLEAIRATLGPAIPQHKVG